MGLPIEKDVRNSDLISLSLSYLGVPINTILHVIVYISLAEFGEKIASNMTMRICKTTKI